MSLVSDRELAISLLSGHEPGKLSQRTGGKKRHHQYVPQCNPNKCRFGKNNGDIHPIFAIRWVSILLHSSSIDLSKASYFIFQAAAELGLKRFPYGRMSFHDDDFRSGEKLRTIPQHTSLLRSDEFASADQTESRGLPALFIRRKGSLGANLPLSTDRDTPQRYRETARQIRRKCIGKNSATSIPCAWSRNWKSSQAAASDYGAFKTGAITARS